MISIFKGSGVFLLILLALVVFGARFPYFNGVLPLLRPELEWMLVGERMGDGYLLYKAIWTNLSPLSAYVYQILDFFSSRSQNLHMILAAIVVVVNIYYFNISLNNRSAFLDKSYVPALILMVFFHLSFDMFKLSPPLMSVLFLMLAFNRIALEMSRGLGVSDEIFEAGLFIGIATLFNLPCVSFIFWVLLCLSLFTGAGAKQYLLAVFGFILPIFFAFLFFYLNNAYTEVMYNWLSSFLRVRLFTLQDLLGLILILIVPVVLAFFGFFKISRTNRFNSYQTRMQQIMLLWLIFSLASLVFISYISPSQIILSLPPLAFFASQLFVLNRRAFINETVFTACVALIAFLFFAGVKNFGAISKPLSMKDQQIKPLDNKKLVGQKILILGNDTDEYAYTKPATCYLNWSLSQIDLKNPDDYVSVINIFENFKADPPDFVIDKEDLLKPIFSKIPELSRKYKKIEQGLYVRI